MECKNHCAPPTNVTAEIGFCTLSPTYTPKDDADKLAKTEICSKCACLPEKFMRLGKAKKNQESSCRQGENLNQ